MDSEIEQWVEGNLVISDDKLKDRYTRISKVRAVKGGNMDLCKMFLICVF